MASQFRNILMIALLLVSSLSIAEVTSDRQLASKFNNDPRILSPVILQRPIYECARTVVVNGYVPNALIQVFTAGNPTPIGSAIAGASSDQSIEISVPFVLGQVITATQTIDGGESSRSNPVTVSSHKVDYPDGLPTPVIRSTPCYECARTVSVSDVIPGAWWKIFIEEPIEGGGFSSPIEAGTVADSPHIHLNTPLKRGQRLTAQSGICSNVSPVSQPKAVQPQPAEIPPPILENAVYEGSNTVVVRGPGARPLLSGAEIRVFTHDRTLGSSQVNALRATSTALQMTLKPVPKARAYWATQALCTASRPGPKIQVKRCNQLPPAKIRDILPGDSLVDVFDFLPGARITIFSGAEEIGDGSGAKIALTRPVNDGDRITVVQSAGSCTGEFTHTVRVGCHDRDPKVCSREWPAFRHSGLRDGQQPFASPLSDPEKVRNLKKKWEFPKADSGMTVGGFRASAIVHEGRVYIGSTDGRLYAIDAAKGELLWQFPRSDRAPLRSKYEQNEKHNDSARGLPASAAIGVVNGREAVIFGAPDQSIGLGFGSGRLFALDPVTGVELWKKSPEIAVLSGIEAGSTSQLHENIGYSSPLVLGNRIFVGISGHHDNPIQNGRVVAVDADSGEIVSTFNFKSTSTRGGGIWSSLSGGLNNDAVYTTTGNARWWHRCQPMRTKRPPCQAQPSIDHSLSLLRLNAATGDVEWKLKPVPFDFDDDPDWATGPTLIAARCGHTVASTQKDGWSYSVDAGRNLRGVPKVRWQFPPTGIPFRSGTHGDTKYIFPGAAWNDTFITTMGGLAVETGEFMSGMTRLYGLDVCANSSDPVRWIADIPGTTSGHDYQLGPPTVTRGIVFIGTRQGHLVVLADPSIWPADGSVCSVPEVKNENCLENGFKLVPRPKRLAEINLNELDADDAILGEPALADGRVFVATRSAVKPGSRESIGRVYMLEPEN
jgi:outer membrane protein assembly factor BamB